jgi:hypothetical protein
MHDGGVRRQRENGGDMGKDFPRCRVHSVQDYSHLRNNPVIEVFP